MSEAQIPRHEPQQPQAADLERQPVAIPNPPRRILVAGSSGFIGSHLCRFLTAHDHEVYKLVRRDPETGSEINWDPDSGKLSAAMLEGFHTVYNLCGTSVGESRWTPARKKVLRSARINSTSLLANTLASLDNPPESFISSSAIGFYGEFHEGGEFTEEDEPGESFLAQLAIDWEAAAQPVVASGIRLVLTRTGVVLNPGGGALVRMLPLFNRGMGGVVGGGKQLVSWISLTDTIRALAWLGEQPSISGPVNLTSPDPVTNRDFTHTLAMQLGKPALVPVPAIAIKAALGEMGEALALKGAAILPTKLLSHGFEFGFGDLEDALKHEFRLYKQIQSIEG